MTITAEESTQQIYDALIKVFKDAKVPKSNDVIPKVAALMKLMLAFIDGDGDLQLHPRSNMPGKVLRLMAEVAQAMLTHATPSSLFLAMVMVAGSLILMKVRRNGARTQGNLSQGKLSQGKVAVGLLLMMMMRSHRGRSPGKIRPKLLRKHQKMPRPSH